MEIDLSIAISEMERPTRHEFIGNEHDFEDYICDNIYEICSVMDLPPIVAVNRQRMIAAGGFFIKPDILVRHTDGTMTVFEVKKANEKYPAAGPMNQMNAVGQLLLYGNVLREIINDSVRLALIDNKIYFRTFSAFVGNNLPITLIEYQNDRIFIPYRGWE